MNIGALILMGGRNSRMGGNIKGLLKINDVTFLEQIMSVLGDFTNIYLSVNKKFSSEDIKQYEDMGLKVIVDSYDDIGPMGGIYSALKDCKEDYLFITACDMPFINKDLIEELKLNVRKDIDIVLFSKERILYPLGAIYSKKLVPQIKELIDNNNYRPLVLIKNSNYIELPLEKTSLDDDVFYNINTPQEYKELVLNYK